MADLNAVAADTWLLLTLAFDENLYYDNFRQPDLAVSVAVAGLAGTVTIDDYVIAPMENLDGSWYATVGGLAQWEREDEFSWADEETVPTVWSEMLWRAGLGSLPSTTGAPTITEPTL